MSGSKVQSRDTPEAIAWLELAAEQGEPQAKTLAEKFRTELTPEQINQFNALKKGLVELN